MWYAALAVVRCCGAVSLERCAWQASVSLGATLGEHF